MAMFDCSFVLKDKADRKEDKEIVAYVLDQTKPTIVSSAVPDGLKTHVESMALLFSDPKKAFEACMHFIDRLCYCL